jgi:hypothetical protein
MNTAIPTLLLLIALLVAALYIKRLEGFWGTSPGTLVQLQASHIPTIEDIPMLKEWIKQRNQGIKEMTEADIEDGMPIEYRVLGTRIGAFA